MTKNRLKIAFPTQLDMVQYLESEEVSPESASSLILGTKHPLPTSKYELRAVIVHHGDANTGNMLHKKPQCCNRDIFICWQSVDCNGFLFVVSNTLLLVLLLLIYYYIIIYTWYCIASGHYTTYALLDLPPGGEAARGGDGAEDHIPRERTSKTEKKWMHFSDEKVSQVTQQEVLESEAYMLFYDKR
jgi:hypothetical protein